MIGTYLSASDLDDMSGLNSTTAGSISKPLSDACSCSDVNVQLLRLWCVDIMSNICNVRPAIQMPFTLNSPACTT